MNFVQGGELFYHLNKKNYFSEAEAKIIIACIILALGHMHNNDYIYRDLKPENVLMDIEGYAMLSDFGLSKCIKRNNLAKTFCGTPEYMSPEMVLRRGCNRPVDWWALGVLTYELLFGFLPFHASNTNTLYKNTVI